MLAEANMKVLRDILDAAAAAPEPAGSVTQQARALGVGVRQRTN
jgi:hypothetical protein